jgi:hypothetical protein
MTRLRAAFAALVVASAPPAAAEFCGAQITSVPQGAQVYVNGRLAGTTPHLAIIGHEARIRVRLAKKGYRTWEGEVHVPHNVITSLSVTLEPASRQPAAATKRPR